MSKYGVSSMSSEVFEHRSTCQIERRSAFESWLSLNKVLVTLKNPSKEMLLTTRVFLDCKKTGCKLIDGPSEDDPRDKMTISSERRICILRRGLVFQLG
jgi:hypothetical protein